MSKIKIITLCGSTRFKSLFEKLTPELTLNGNIVLDLGFYGQLPGENKNLPVVSLKTEILLQRLHFRRIELADIIYFINPNGYMGAETMREFNYANKLKKKIRFYCRKNIDATRLKKAD